MPDASNDSKICFETKMKAAFSGDVHECSVKQDGTATYELKSNILEVNKLFKFIIIEMG